MQPIKSYRSRALDVLRGNWKPYVLASLVLVLLALAIEVPSQLLLKTRPGLAMAILYPLMFLVYLPIAYAYSVGMLDKYRGAEAPLCGHMFRLFKAEYGRGLLAYLLMMAYAALMMIGVIFAAVLLSALIGAFTGDVHAFMGPEGPFMWVYFCLIMLGMIPVMIWVYAVSQMFYLAHERKELKLRECLKLSKKMMKGHKWQLFCLQLSFIGWILLGYLTLLIGLLWVLPYMSMAQAIFFDDLEKEYFGEAEQPAEVPAAEPAAPIEAPAAE